jgi:tetratricopeptide (TPR) repeat protein
MSRRSKKKAAPGKAPTLHSGTVGLNDRWTVFGVCIFLAAITWAVFGQTLRHGFVNFDDNDYVYQNLVVQKGLTLQGIVWAFTHVYAANWHPLTWISHMLDCQFYGLNPGGHHFTNVLLHTTTSILLFLLLWQMTGFLWRSAFVAAVFAIHPLRVESVAWVAERKDVLSGVFFMLTLGAYVRYARGPWSAARYGLVVALFALGLMSKPMLVTLPFVLLLLDYWPLNRLGDRRIVKRVILEKLPLLGLAAASCAVTLFAQTNALAPLDQISFPMRMGNALIAYVIYIGQMFWPMGLAVLYPFPANGGPFWEKILAPILLLSITAGVFGLRKSRPYLLVGWLWYLVMLIPVIGILQVGIQARADRYTYLPQIGLYLMLAWSAADLSASWRNRRTLLGGMAVVILAALMLCARAQAAYWRDSESLWIHTLACTTDNDYGQNNLGNALSQTGSVDEAIAHFQKAMQINPDYADAHYNLGVARFRTGRVDDAIAQYQKALQINPDFAQAHNNLGNALFQKGRVNDAIAHYQQALQINPDFAEAQNNLAWVLATGPQASLRNGNRAVELAERANQLTQDGNPVFLGTLAAAYAEAGRFPEAVKTAQRALQLAGTQPNPALADALQSQMKLYQAGLPFHLH